MPVEVGLFGAAGFRHAAAGFHAAARAVPGDLLDVSDRVADRAERSVRSRSDEYAPRGYEQTVRRTLVTRRSRRVTAGVARVTIRFSARGDRGNDRQVRDLEAGQLRHPVYGRFRRLRSGRRMANPWVVQRVRPRFVSEPATAAAERAWREYERIPDSANKTIREAL